MKKILFFLLFFINLHIHYADGGFLLFHFQELHAQVMQREDGYYVCWDEELGQSYVSSVSTCDVEVEKYVCSKCSSTFDTEYERDEHEKSCDGKFYCAYCNQEFNSASSRDSHQNSCSKKPKSGDSSQTGSPNGSTDSNTSENSNNSNSNNASSSTNSASNSVSVSVSSNVTFANDSVKAKALKILKRTTGNKKLTITSQKRTVKSQAQAMLTNIKAGRNIKYKEYGEKVKQVYDPTKTDEENLQAMIDKINELGPGNVSVHLRSSGLSAVDVDKSGIDKDTLVSCLRNDTDVTRVLVEPHCIHFEFNQK